MAGPEAWLRGAIEDAEVPAYPLGCDEGTAPPYVIYARTQTDRERSLEEPAGHPVGTFTLEVYADGYATVKALADAVRQQVANFTGEADGCTIDETFLVNEVDGDPVFLEGRDRPTYLVEMTLAIRWQE